MRRPPTNFVAMASFLLTLAAACGGSSSHQSSGASSSSPRPTSSTTTAPAATPTTTSVAGVDPNAPEVVQPGDIPDNQAFVAFTPTSGGYSLKVPEGWARSENGATVTFTDHYNTITGTTTNAPAAPTLASVSNTDVPALEASTSHFELVSVTAVARPAGPAILVTYRAASEPDSVTGKRVAIDVERYEFWHAGTLVTLTLSGARGSDNVDPWRTVTDSISWTA